MSVTIPGPFVSSAVVRREPSGAARFALPVYLYAVSLAALLTVDDDNGRTGRPAL
jgi:hypothetical protein